MAVYRLRKSRRGNVEDRRTPSSERLSSVSPTARGFWSSRRISKRAKSRSPSLLGNGRSGVQPDRADSLWETQLFPLVGTEKLPLAQITQWAQENDKVASVGFDAGNREFILKGETRPADLLTQMQMLAAYARDTGFRPEAIEKAKSVAPMIAGQIAGNPGAVYSRGAQALMVGNDTRFQVLPTEKGLASVEPE